MRTTPQQVRLILVDPKRVELGQYNAVPHLLTEVVTNPKKAANALDWAVREMEMRYDMLAEVGVRDITGYNAMYDRGDLPTADDPDPETGKHYDRLPFIVVVVDELADLMMVAARDVETSICRLAQMARAVGIHLVIATQRPSVDVITGVIKANIPSRLAFSVSTLADSRVILDQPGAEKLIGKGDMLMLTASSSRTERIQGAWVDEECVRKVVAHWRRQTVRPNYIDGVQGDDGPRRRRSGSRRRRRRRAARRGDGARRPQRPRLDEHAATQAARRVRTRRSLMDLLERRGIVGPSEGSKARTVLMTVEELEEHATERLPGGNASGGGICVDAAPVRVLVSAQRAARPRLGRRTIRAPLVLASGSLGGADVRRLAERLVAAGLVVREVGKQRPPRHSEAGDHEAGDPDARVGVADVDTPAREDRVVEKDGVAPTATTNVSSERHSAQRRRQRR